MDLDVFNQLREAIANVIKISLPEPQASLLLGILIGIKSSFPPSFYEALRVTGTLHIVVVSGYNISVLINTLGRLLIFLPLKIRFGVTLIFLLFFVLLVGPEPPVVRAAIMGAIGLLGTILGRQKDAFRILVLSGAAMVVFNPAWITELSFQLSFLATLGLILIFPILDRITPDKGGFLRDDFLTTLSAQITVWPLIAFSFVQASLLSPLANVLVLWTIPIITYLGLVATTLALIINNFTELIMIPLDFFLSYFIWIVTGEFWRFGFFEVGAFSFLALGFYYIILWGGLWFLYQTFQKK